MKKTLSFLSVCLATMLASGTVTSITSFADVPQKTTVIAKSNTPGHDIQPYFLYMQSIDLSVNPSSSKTSYTIYIEGTEELKSVKGTATLYKKDSSGNYVKKASKTHTLEGPRIMESFSFNSYGPGEYKITFKGTAYSTNNGSESIDITSYNSY